MDSNENLRRTKRFSLALVATSGLALCVLLAGGLTWDRHNAMPVSGGAQITQSAAHDPAPVVLACPGRVEGLTEVVNVGAGVDGVLLEVRVKEGQQVRAGDLLARLDCRDLEAELPVAQAATESARQTRERLLRGSRTEERRLALDYQAREEAVLQQARSQHQRMAKLYESGDISREVFEKARRDLDVAQAARNAAENQLALVNAQPLPEELAKATAEIRVAEGRARVLVEKIRKCTIHSPASGTVLRTHLRASEAISATIAPTVVSLADLSRLKVRAEVDERDLSRIFNGQEVLVTAPAFPERKFRGQVARLGEQMGRKRVRTGDPAEKSDRDVLEVLIDLAETDARLVIGLRTTVQFLGKRNR
jgi:HlyD family secretion protein